MKNELTIHAQSIMKQTYYASVATVSKSGQPWNTPVLYAYSDTYEIYWGSFKDSRHSKNIRATGTAFLSIYNSTVRPGTGEGVYIQAECSEIEDETGINKAVSLLSLRRSPIPYWDREYFSIHKPIRIYRALPIKTWINGEDTVQGVYIDRLQKVNLRLKTVR